jgi:hypothetical protein
LHDNHNYEDFVQLQLVKPSGKNFCNKRGPIIKHGIASTIREAFFRTFSHLEVALPILISPILAFFYYLKNFKPTISRS